MNTPFRLDQHPRRPQPLAAPPAGYFEQLPTRVMARLPRPAAGRSAAPGGAWWRALPGAWRTSVAAAAVLLSFVVAFWLVGAPAAPTTVASLDAVPQPELVSYLLESGAAVETSDLAVLTAAHPAATALFPRPTADEIEAALDAQPTEEALYF